MQHAVQRLRICEAHRRRLQGEDSQGGWRQHAGGGAARTGAARSAAAPCHAHACPLAPKRSRARLRVMSHAR
jgi:hypothetical protein